MYNSFKLCGIRGARRFTTYLSEHSGLHLKVSMCLERQPLEYQEDEVEKAFREFRELFSLKTRNSLKIPDISKIERKITHKIPRTRAAKPSSTTASSGRNIASRTDESSAGGGVVEDLETLLSEEVNLRMLPRRSRRAAARDREEEVCKSESDDDLTNISRRPKNWLFFLVKTKDGRWTFPTVDLFHGHSMRDTLVRICEEQFEGGYRPFFLGYSPFTHSVDPLKRYNSGNGHESLGSSGSEISGVKTFYYRARHVPETPFRSKVEDYAWCTMQEMRERLDVLGYSKVINSLPLVP